MSRLSASVSLQTVEVSQLLGKSLAVAVVGCSCFLGGCGGSGSSPSTPPAVASGAAATGNWQIALSATSNVLPFPVLSGYIKDDDSNSTPSAFITAEMTAESSTSCFIGRNSVFLYASRNGLAIPFSSASVDGQFVELGATLNSAASTMTGTYQINGGCADGASGTISGFRVSPVTGTYSGSFTGMSQSGTLQLTLSQNSYGNGNGYFEFNGSASLTGISCFKGGTIVAQSSLVTGTSVQLTLSTADPTGAQLIMQGSVDAAAHTLTLSSIQVTSGACFGQYGTSTLTL